MRAYFFGNFYLSSIQQGIQAAHCMAEMFLKYTLNKKADMLYEWGKDHRTVILLNGGDNDALVDMTEFLEDTEENPYPWGAFVESVDALNNSYTCVGVILPKKIYESIEEVKQTDHCYSDLSNWEFELVVRISEYKMAR